MKRKAVSCLLVLAALITMTPTIPTLAAENPDNTIQSTQTTTETGTQNSVVKYDQASAFTVTIPKAITIPSAKTATYDIKVKGDIKKSEKITVTPDATVSMTDTNGKDAVDITITQTVKEFAADDVNATEGISTTGSIDGSNLTAGSWSGTLNFAIDKVATAGNTENKDEIVDPSVGEYTEFTLTKDNYQMAGIERTGNVVIPETFEYDGVNYKVTTIGQNAFNGCTNLTSVTIPEGVTSIGEYAFYYCKNLTSVTIPNSVTSIDNDAFASCHKLTRVTIPNSVTSIGESAFASCIKLTSITIPEGVTSIGYKTFSNCTSLTSVTIPNSVTSIGYKAFDGVRHIYYHGTATGSPWGALAIN